MYVRVVLSTFISKFYYNILNYYKNLSFFIFQEWIKLFLNWNQWIGLIFLHKIMVELGMIKKSVSKRHFLVPVNCCWNVWHRS